MESEHLGQFHLEKCERNRSTVTLQCICTSADVSRRLGSSFTSSCTVVGPYRESYGWLKVRARLQAGTVIDTGGMADLRIPRCLLSLPCKYTWDLG